MTYRPALFALLLGLSVIGLSAC
ncbi:DUF4136 domain-containing protein, partial [Pseudomonas syringae pv. actinidiae]|nr:DUF4136 domain-containing protein [Pseudomonas syringae pv. actinidiae]